jgi:hypothetical protein
VTNVGRSARLGPPQGSLKSFLHIALSSVRVDWLLCRVCGYKGTKFQVVKDWNEASRYRLTPRHKVKKLYRAIADKSHRVLQWMTARW